MNPYVLPNWNPNETRIVPIAIDALTITIKVVGKNADERILNESLWRSLTKQRNEENLRNLYCYDRSLDHYWKPHRELADDEWLEIDRRIKNGERFSDTLDELKVLK